MNMYNILKFNLKAINFFYHVSCLESDHNFTPRTVINAGETLRFKVAFKPGKCGNYEHTFTIEMVGWFTKYHIVCKGQCGIPVLDMRPERLFPKVAKKRAKKNMYLNSLFLEELNVFDFGPLLIQDKEDLK